MNFKALKKDPIFFKLYGIACLKQTKSSHVMEKNTQNEGSVGFIVDPHTPKIGPRPILVAIESLI
jgi:hypothetical protein